MKIVYFGTDVFLSCFEYFVREHQVLALYTYHNDEDYFTEYAVVKQARELRIPVHYEAITPEQICRYFREEGCGLLFVAEYNRMLPVPEDLPSFRAVNTHSSLLPQGRSYYPIEAAMARGLSETGVTMHKVAPKLDQGDILAQRSFPILPETDSVDVYLQCAANAREMLEEIMEDLEKAWHDARPQVERLPYWRRPEADAMTLCPDMTRQEAETVFRKFNGMTQALLKGSWYYVTSLTSGPAALGCECQFLSDTRVLCRVRDGHLRLQIHPMEESK